ncbi:DUF4186 family protein, partial [Escherichia coli]
MKERQYWLEKSARVIERHAKAFVATSLATACPANCDKTTPMRRHPVF